MNLKDARRAQHKNFVPRSVLDGLRLLSGVIVLDYDRAIVLGTPRQISKHIAMLGADQVVELPKFDTGVWFYAEYSDAAAKRRDHTRNASQCNGNVVAIYIDEWNSNRLNTPMGFGTVETHPAPNTEMLSYDEYSWEYLRERCKRVSFDVAVKIHPALFAGGFLNQDAELTTIEPVEI